MNIFMENNPEFVNLQVFFEKPSYVYKTFINQREENKYLDYKLLQLSIRLYRYRDLEDFNFSTLQEIYYQKLWVLALNIMKKHIAIYLKLKLTMNNHCNFSGQEIIESAATEVFLSLRKNHNFNKLPNININIILKSFFCNINDLQNILYQSKLEDITDLKSRMQNIKMVNIEDENCFKGLSCIDNNYTRYEEKEYIEKKILSNFTKYKKYCRHKHSVDIKKIIKDETFFEEQEDYKILKEVSMEMKKNQSVNLANFF